VHAMPSAARRTNQPLPIIFGDDKSAGNPVSALNGVEATPSIMSLRQ